MGLYAEHILPHVIDFAMRYPEARARRAVVVPQARGRVLELGIGSGLNLPFYGAVSALDAIDPSVRLLDMTEKKLAGIPFRVALHRASAEQLPFESHTFDTVLTTWTLCSIPEVGQALKEVCRVLKPGGRLLFIEHGAAPDESVRRWQQRIDPVWTRFAGGCHLDRPMDSLIGSAGLRVEGLLARYLEGPRFVTYTYEGSAVPLA